MPTTQQPWGVNETAVILVILGIGEERDQDLQLK